jgi:hypothetical protein
MDLSNNLSVRKQMSSEDIYNAVVEIVDEAINDKREEVETLVRGIVETDVYDAVQSYIDNEVDFYGIVDEAIRYGGTTFDSASIDDFDNAVEAVVEGMDLSANTNESDPSVEALIAEVHRLSSRLAEIEDVIAKVGAAIVTNPVEDDGYEAPYTAPDFVGGAI